MMTHLILVRHGETAWTKEKRYQGNTDIPLSSEGRKSMRVLAAAVKKLSPDVLYTSALKRAKHSAAEITSRTGLKARVDRRLNELSFGEWEGHTAAELARKKNRAFLSWAKGKWVTPRGGESMHALRLRTLAFMKECLRKHKGKTVALVCHGGVIRMLIANSLRLPERFLFSFQSDPASFAVLRFDSKNTARLLCLNVRRKYSLKPVVF